MKSKETDKFKALANAKCEYPNCGKKQMMTCGLQILNATESGQLISAQDGKDQAMTVGVPLCEEHMIYAMQGLLAAVEEKGQFRLHGPFELIHIVNAVLEAGKFKEDLGKKQKEKNVQTN